MFAIALRSDGANDKIVVYMSKTSKKPSKLTCDKTFEVSLAFGITLRIEKAKRFALYEEERSPFFKIDTLHFGVFVQIKYSFQSNITNSPPNRDKPDKPANLTAVESDYKFTPEFEREIGNCT